MSSRPLNQDLPISYALANHFSSTHRTKHVIEIHSNGYFLGTNYQRMLTRSRDLCTGVRRL